VAATSQCSMRLVVGRRSQLKAREGHAWLAAAAGREGN
jgi:hypothetical protein